MQLVKMIIFAIFATLTFAVCSSPNAQEPRETALDTEVIPPGATSVPFDRIEWSITPVSGIRDRRRLVIRDAEDWSSYWDELHATLIPTPQPPALDFSGRMVIAATLGRRATGGHTVTITEVFQNGEDLFVVVLETSPGPGCLTTQALGAPAVAVSVPRIGGEVTFVEQTETLDCQ